MEERRESHGSSPPSGVKRDDGSAHLLKYLIELSPEFVFLRAVEMAEGAFVFPPHLSHLGLRLEMVEVKVPPISRVPEALGVLSRSHRRR